MSTTDGLERFTTELAHWGERMNLVGSTDRAALQRHIDDSSAAVASLSHGARVVDLGSGAGFPGIPIALARPDLRLTLVEIREKRIHFLRHVVRALALEIEVRRTSLEAPDPGEDRFDFALLRAVAEFPKSLEYGRRWVHDSGEVWIWSSLSETEAARSGALAGSIPLRSGGRILRVRAAEVSRGTHG